MVVMLNDTSKMQGEAFVGYTNISLHATFIPMPSHIGWTMVIMHLKKLMEKHGLVQCLLHIHTSLLISITPRKHLASKGLY